MRRQDRLSLLLAFLVAAVLAIFSGRDSRAAYSSNGGAPCYGDGSDGGLTVAAGTTTSLVALGRDAYYTTAVVNGSLLLGGWGGSANGVQYRVYATQSIIVNSGGLICCNGNSGLADGTAGGALNGGSMPSGNNPGGAGQTTNGSNGASLSATLGGSGGAGGHGATTNTGGSLGVATALGIQNTFRGCVQYGNFAASSGGASFTAMVPGCGGGGGGGDGSVKGGGGGSGGGTAFLAAPMVVVYSGGTVQANGGTGGSPSSGTTGGGAAGGGGVVFIIARDYFNGGTVQAVTGAIGYAHATSASNATNGAVGSSGHVYWIPGE